jgi:formylmethanofuran dehydrogenase subunit C
LNKLVLTPRGFSSIPLEADVISPDVFAGKSVKEIRELKIHYGNREVEMSEYIHVQGKVADTPEEQRIVIDGDARHIKYIGRGMTAGRIVVQGDAGMHTGSQMAGGDLTVAGNVGDWAGAEMKGGLMRVLGDAGNLLGAAYRGSSEGMTGGCILVKGRVGSEAASFMRRGMLVVEGDTGPFTGVHMNGGEVLVFGRLGKRAGAQAKGNGGFITSFGGAEEMLPTYVYETTYTPNFMRLYLMQLAGNLGIERAAGFIDAPLKRYRGDMAVGGSSEILVAEKVGA